MLLWKKWARRAGIGCGALMAAVALGGFFLPASLEVERERMMPFAPPEIYDRVASLRRWPEWGVWWQREPFLETEFAGPETGAGAAMEWTSKHQGTGHARITAVAPGREVGVAFDFGERGDARCRIRLDGTGNISAGAATAADREGENAGQGVKVREPEENLTRVRWRLRADFGGNTGRRWFGLFFRRQLESDLDASLALLEEAVARNSTPLPAPAAVPEGKKNGL